MEAAPTPLTATEWAIHLAQEEERLRKVYLLSPGHLIAESRQERKITRGYHGRELLELLQNAGDAARNAGLPGCVRIVVNQHGVVIGNTGHPFDKGGVESLRTANLSPKRQIEGVLIGDKGLGFRAILNWTHAPLISSGELGLAFLPDYSAKVVRELESQSKDLASRVAKERKVAGALIVPRLAFPQCIPEWAAHPWPDDEGLRSIAAACQGLRSEGFDTAIGMPFAAAHAYTEAVRQADELNPEFLLLVESISTLEIAVEGRAAKEWCCERTGQRWTIREGSQEFSSWVVTTFDGEVPGELLDQEEKTKNRYKLTLAVPDSGQSSPGHLFCYFPTDVEMPLPLLAHATVELDETRKHVIDTRANRYILSCLAERIAEIAEQKIGPPVQDAWAGCRLVTTVGTWSGDLQRLGFAEALKAAAKRKNLVPVLGGGHATAADAKRAPGNETMWWPRRHFPELAAITTEEERKLAQTFDVEELHASLIAQRLLGVGDLTLEERAHAVAGLLKTKDKLVIEGISALLCDETGAPLPMGVTVMLQPTGSLPPLPTWAMIRFLHPELRQHLAAALETTDNRDLQQRLRPLGVVEYSLTALIRPVLAEANRLVHEANEVEPQIRAEVLEFLWRVYAGIEGETSFPADVSLKLPNQAGSWEPPGILYLGEGYGQEGHVTQDLYSGWAKEKLIKGPSNLGLPTEVMTDDLSPFLLWLGVERWPREETVESPENGFVQMVINGLHYPVRFRDVDVYTPHKLAGAQFTNAKTIDGLRQILKHAAPEAVLAWLALDPRSMAWGRLAREHGTLTIRPYKAWYDRSYNGAVPSYTHWQISNFPWLPTMDGCKKAPRHCLLGDRILEAFFPQPKQPEAILETRYGVSGRTADCYVLAGVMPGLGQLERDQLYRLLLEVPSLSPDGKASRALCRWLLQNEADLLGFAGEHQKRFFQEGQLWGSKAGQSGYFAIAELRHVDFEGLPPALLLKLAIADLPKRVGAEKVTRVLGVTALDRSAVRQDLVSHRTSPYHEDRAHWFREAKPAIKRLRQAQIKKSQSMEILDQLKLVLCDELRVRMEYEGTSYDHMAQEGEWFNFSEALYVRGDLENSKDLLADAAGVAIASVFGVADGDAFSRILNCEPINRVKLLKRMCGDAFQAEIEAAEALPRPKYSGPIAPPTDLNPVVEDTSPAPQSTQSTPPERSPSQGPDSANALVPGVRLVEHVPQSAKESRKLIVRNVQRKTGKPNTGRRMADGEKCEQMAIAFEEQCNPPRFALLVGHITGADAPGCDLVSFDSAEDRQACMLPDTRDWGMVRRFIEVKGRSASTAKIELRGNELVAARKYRDKYYLYRFFDATDGQYEVSILQNPLDSEGATSYFAEIDLERAKTTQRFEFVVDSHALGPEENETENKTG
jgi:hypothetical protein